MGSQFINSEVASQKVGCDVLADDFGIFTLLADKNK
jgi:hypothetical protein